MFGFSQRKARPVDRRRSLAGIPVLNPGVSVKEEGAGCLRVTVRRRRGSGFLARFQPPVLERNVELDELGAFVFRQIDGRCSTADIIDLFTRAHKVNRREAELSCVAFLKSLAARGVISIAVK
jgi:hypothetical protein